MSIGVTSLLISFTRLKRPVASDEVVHKQAADLAGKGLLLSALQQAPKAPAVPAETPADTGSKLLWWVVGAAVLLALLHFIIR